MKLIEYKAFMGCASLRTVVFTGSSTLETIQWSAFNDCKSLSTVVIRASYPPSIEDNSFNGILDGATLVVPLGKGDLYRHSNWNRFFRIVEE